MKKILFLFLIISCFGYSQSYKEISQKICDSICKNNFIELDSVSNINKKEAIYSWFLVKELTKSKDEEQKQNFSKLTYLINRELIRDCENYKPNGNLFLRTVNVIDIDNAFNANEIVNLENKVNEIFKTKNLKILVFTIDDYFPKKEIDELSYYLLDDWNPRLSTKKDKIIILLSKSKREVRISTTSKSKPFLSDSFLQNIINDEMLPFFKQGKFYDGILNSLNKISDQL